MESDAVYSAPHVKDNFDFARVIPMQNVIQYPRSAEDRATLRSDPSADPSHGRAT